MDTKAAGSGTRVVRATAGTMDAAGLGSRRSRRVWSEEEKRRIVAEASQAGASVADIARRHGMNANLLFTWRRAAQAAARGGELNGAAADGQPAATSLASEAPAFLPLGVFEPGEDGEPALIAAPAPMAASQPSPRARAGLVRDERPGVIEIDLADGTRLRVDAFVNERALRRVMAVLRATS